LSLGDLTEDNVLAIEPRGDDGGDEELGSVGVGSGVGHGEEERSVVPELEVLVGELVAVDGLSTGTVVVGELEMGQPKKRVKALRKARSKTHTSPPWSMKLGMTRWKPDPA
jgi:hypothetical protein